MTPADLRAAGEALFGCRWQSPLAEALGVNARTLRRWLTGEIAIGEWVAPAVSRLLLERQVVIARLLAA